MLKNGNCWVSAVGRARGQKGGTEQREPSPKSAWTLSVGSPGCRVWGALGGCSVSVCPFCWPSPFITGPAINLARPGLGVVFVLITVYIISSQHVEVIESCSSKLPISSSH